MQDGGQAAHPPPPSPGPAAAATAGAAPRAAPTGTTILPQAAAATAADGNNSAQVLDGTTPPKAAGSNGVVRRMDEQGSEPHAPKSEAGLGHQSKAGSHDQDSEDAEELSTELPDSPLGDLQGGGGAAGAEEAQGDGDGEMEWQQNPVFSTTLNNSSSVVWGGVHAATGTASGHPLLTRDSGGAQHRGAVLEGGGAGAVSDAKGRVGHASQQVSAGVRLGQGQGAAGPASAPASRMQSQAAQAAQAAHSPKGERQSSLIRHSSLAPHPPLTGLQAPSFWQRPSLTEVARDAAEVLHGQVAPGVGSFGAAGGMSGGGVAGGSRAAGFPAPDQLSPRPSAASALPSHSPLTRGPPLPALLIPALGDSMTEPAVTTGQGSSDEGSGGGGLEATLGGGILSSFARERRHHSRDGTGGVKLQPERTSTASMSSSGDRRRFSDPHGLSGFPHLDSGAGMEGGALAGTGAPVVGAGGEARMAALGVRCLRSAGSAMPSGGLEGAGAPSPARPRALSMTPITDLSAAACAMQQPVVGGVRGLLSVATRPRSGNIPLMPGSHRLGSGVLHTGSPAAAGLVLPSALQGSHTPSHSARALPPLQTGPTSPPSAAPSSPFHGRRVPATSPTKARESGKPGLRPTSGSSPWRHPSQPQNAGPLSPGGARGALLGSRAHTPPGGKLPSLGAAAAVSDLEAGLVAQVAEMKKWRVRKGVKKKL